MTALEENNLEKDTHLIHACKSNFQFKEVEGKQFLTGLIATSNEDRVNDILSLSALEQIRDLINDESKVGDQHGSYRSVGVAHDWIKSGDPELDVAAMLEPTARVVDLKDGHKGVEVDLTLNDFYRGEYSPEEIKYRIENGYFAGLSIEYDCDNTQCKTVYLNGSEYRYIDELTEFGGSSFARSRLIANPSCVLYKEIESEIEKMGKKKVDKKMEVKEETLESKVESTPEVKEELTPETPVVPETKEETKEAIQEEVAEPVVEAKVAEEVLEQKEVKASEAKSEPKFSVKEILQNKEFMSEIEKNINVKNKIINTKQEKMDTVPLSIKEMNAQLDSNEFNAFKYKEATSMYFKENSDSIAKNLVRGIPLNTTLQVKCNGTKMSVVGNFQTKDTLDTGTNPSAYTQTGVEFADVYLPGIIDTFNNQTNLFGQLQKKDHIEGGYKYGWRIKTEQQNTLSVDPDDNSVNKIAVKKLKLQTDIKEYRLGVSVNDYTLHHSRASMGDLFRVEVESVTRDLMKDINGDLFTEQADGDGTKVLGLEAVADSAGNTTIYGLSRTAANRLGPDAAGDTYTAVGGALTTALMRTAMTKLEVEGTQRGNLRIIVNPNQRDNLFELEDGNQRYGVKPQLGFEGVISYDGVPVIVDSDCQTDALFVVDWECYYIVMSRAPQLIGLAKVGAAEEAYVSTYMAAVYEQPRRIHMLDTLTV